MKNANQIRHLLKEALLEFQKLALSRFANAAVNKVQQALALLPCETCNGTKQVPTPQSVGFGHENEIMDTCPDCSPKKIPNINPVETIAEYPESQPKRECKNSKACTRYMDGTCEDCPDYK